MAGTDGGVRPGVFPSSAAGPRPAGVPDGRLVTARGMSVDEVVTEVGSATYDHRRRLAKLLADPLTTTVVVEHRGRLARFGVEHLEAALAAHGRKVLVVDNA